MKTGVLAQVDEEIAAEEKRQAVRMLQKELTDINTDIRLKLSFYFLA